MESFSQFASDLDESTRKMLANGEKMVELIEKQNNIHTHLWMNKVISFLFAAIHGYILGTQSTTE